MILNSALPQKLDCIISILFHFLLPSFPSVEPIFPIQYAVFPFFYSHVQISIPQTFLLPKKSQTEF